MRTIAAILISLAMISCEDDASEPDCFDPEKVEDPLVCPDVVLPVCGCDGKTYNNACEAGGSGLTTWTEGAC